MNFFYPIIRFQNRILNLSFGVILLMIPVLVFYRSFKIKKISLKITSVFISGIVSFFSAIFILILLFNIQLISENNYDPSYEVIHMITAKDYDVVTYRINSGAMSSYGVKVFQEKSIPMGFKIVKELYTASRKAEVTVALEDDKVFIDEKQFILKQNIY